MHRNTITYLSQHPYHFCPWPKYFIERSRYAGGTQFRSSLAAISHLAIEDTKDIENLNPVLSVSSVVNLKTVCRLLNMSEHI